MNDEGRRRRRRRRRRSSVDRDPGVWSRARKTKRSEVRSEENKQVGNSLFFQSCWVERVEASRYLDSGDSGMYLKRPVGWWIGPPKRRVAWGVRYAANGGIALLLLLGLLANLTVMGSVEPFGIVPFSSWMARSASTRWSNLMKPTPFDRPATPKSNTCTIVLSVQGWPPSPTLRRKAP